MHLQVQIQEVSGTASQHIGILKYQYSKAGGTWTDTGTTLTINTDQNTTYQFRSLDKAGNISQITGNYTIRRDATLPTTPDVSIASGTLGNNSWYRSNIGIKISVGTDSGAGVNRVTYTLSGATTKAETTITTGGTITITAEGTTNISAYTYDNAGNKSAVKTISVKKDTIAPTISLTQNNTTAKEYNKVITANINDTVSGVNVKKYKEKDRNTTYFASGGNNLTIGTITVNTAMQEVAIQNGPSNIYTIYAKDNAGNESISKISLQNLLVQNELMRPWSLSAHKNDGSAPAISNPDGSFGLPQNYIQYGPYWDLKAGTYQVTYTGENLQYNKIIESYTNKGEDYPITKLKETATELTYTITLNKDQPAVEFYLYNGYNTTIKINSITVKQLN